MAAHRRIVTVILVILTGACSGGTQLLPATSRATSTTASVAATSTTATAITTTTEPIEPLAVGVDWMKVADDTTPFEGAALSDIAAFDGGWVIVGVTGDEGRLGIWLSSNGIDWSKVSDDALGSDVSDLVVIDGAPQCGPRSFLRPYGPYLGPAVGTRDDLIIVACGDGIWYSNAGTDWERAAVVAPGYYLPRTIPRTEAVSLKVVTIQDIAAGPDGFVAVGQGVYGSSLASVSHTATVWESPDGISWTIAEGNKAQFWDTTMWYEAEIQAVTAFDGIWVAGGTIHPLYEDENVAFWISEDGRDYALIADDPDLGTFPAPETQGVTGIAATDGRLIAVGWDSPSSYWDGGTSNRTETGRAAIWTSADGSEWERVAADAAALGGPGYVAATDIVLAETGFVAVGAGFEGYDGRGIVWTSVNGREWTRQEHSRSGTDTPGALAAVAAGPSGLVAVGGAGVWVSGDFPVARIGETNP
jgi:hypothetical protein